MGINLNKHNHMMQLPFIMLIASKQKFLGIMKFLFKNKMLKSKVNQ